MVSCVLFAFRRHWKAGRSSFYVVRVCSVARVS
ncbi:hypothetical protein [Paracoccus sp. (in: a-proteobacteria)]